MRRINIFPIMSLKYWLIQYFIICKMHTKILKNSKTILYLFLQMWTLSKVMVPIKVFVVSSIKKMLSRGSSPSSLLQILDSFCCFSWPLRRHLVICITWFGFFSVLLSHVAPKWRAAKALSLWFWMFCSWQTAF